MGPLKTAVRVSIKGRNMLFPRKLPQEIPLLLGANLRIPVLMIVPDKDLQANKLAMLSNIGDVSEYVHTYVLVA